MPNPRTLGGQTPLRADTESPDWVSPLLASHSISRAISRFLRYPQCSSSFCSVSPMSYKCPGKDPKGTRDAELGGYEQPNEIWNRPQPDARSFHALAWPRRRTETARCTRLLGIVVNG